MVRPTKFRKVDFFPKEDYFTPIGSDNLVEEIVIKLEELEAMRLKDIEELNQVECAERMQVSRPTFQNIIDSARKKVALALTEGKAIRIGGGFYTTRHCVFKCIDCDKLYEINFEQDKKICPACNSPRVSCNKKDENCCKWCKCQFTKDIHNRQVEKQE